MLNLHNVRIDYIFTVLNINNFVQKKNPRKLSIRIVELKNVLKAFLLTFINFSSFVLLQLRFAPLLSSV